jgi:hypothetical protein
MASGQQIVDDSIGGKLRAVVKKHSNFLVSSQSWAARRGLQDVQVGQDVGILIVVQTQITGREIGIGRRYFQEFRSLISYYVLYKALR